MRDRARRQWRKIERTGDGLAILKIEAPDGEIPSQALVRLRDSESARIVGEQKLGGDLVWIQQPKGEFQVEVEAPGYRRSSFTIELGDKPMGYLLVLQESALPLNVQRLVATRRVQAEESELDLR